MKHKIAMYLAGSIKKSHENANESFWTDEDMTFIRHHLKEYKVSFLNPALRTDDLSDYHSVFGRDMTQIFCSDLVFVDARDRRGLGVGAEMMWAKVNRIPVLTWAPKNTHYNKGKATVLDVSVENYIHPFVASLSDMIVDNLDEATEWIRKLSKEASTKIKGIEHINSSMEYYKEKQFPHDTIMRELLFCEDLQKRIDRAHPQVLY